MDRMILIWSCNKNDNTSYIMSCNLLDPFCNLLDPFYPQALHWFVHILGHVFRGMSGMAEVVWMPIPVHLAGEVQQLINARMVIQIDAFRDGGRSTGMIWEVWRAKHQAGLIWGWVKTLYP